MDQLGSFSGIISRVRHLVIGNGNIFVEESDGKTKGCAGSQDEGSYSFNAKKCCDWCAPPLKNHALPRQISCVHLPHDNRLPEDVLESILNQDLRLPKPIRRRVSKGVSAWGAAVGYHREINAHHNYVTTNRVVAQEIALDFFSSALVGCLMRGSPVTAGLVKKASSTMQKWPNFISASDVVRSELALVRDALFRYYGIDIDTPEQTLPCKTYDIDVARQRAASKTLQRHRLKKNGNPAPLEVDVVKELLTWMLQQKDDDDETEAMRMKFVWMHIFPIFFTETEMGKWVMEVVYHKQLIVDFHNIVKTTPGYEINDSIAHDHDNDKYLPFQLVAYALKWYYGEECDL